MSFIDDITVLILTYNEAPNIARTLDRLRWASRIVVVDSGSTDGTLEILSQCAQAQSIHRTFDTFADQCNFGIAQVRTTWVLSLDADYELSHELVSELETLDGSGNVVGYRASFVYRVYGCPLRGSLYPPRTILYRACAGRYVNEGHGHRVRLSGDVRPLRGVVFHDDRKPMSDWFAAQQRYATVEVDYLLATSRSELSWPDSVRLWNWPAPFIVFVYTLIWKRCILDGWPGWFYVLQRTLAEILLALELVDRRFRRTDR